MPQQPRFTQLRMLSLAAVSAVIALAGCDMLRLLPVRPEKPDTAKLETVKTVPTPIDPVILPSKYQCRVSQYLFFADFEITRELPLFRELEDMREQVHKTLQLPPSNNLVQVYLFEDSDRYERFMKSKYPELPRRRAFFIAQPRPIGGEELLVYTYWGSGERIQQDLRHELTHALLHSVLKDVPLWLDEGLAEYFEIPPGRHAINPEHMKQLRQGPSGPAHGNLARLEQLTQVEQMTPAEYREAWAWVHFMLHGSEDSRRVLVGYLKDLRSTKAAGSLRTRLTAFFPSPEISMERHLLLLDQQRGPVITSNH